MGNKEWMKKRSGIIEIRWLVHVGVSLSEGILGVGEANWSKKIKKQDFNPTCSQVQKMR